MPRSVCHRLLADLKQRGDVRQPRAQGDCDYAMTTKLMSLGLAYLSTSGIGDIAEPLIERVAQQSGELVRLAIIDGDRLTWVAKSQVARKGLRYDPDMGTDARLSCTRHRPRVAADAHRRARARTGVAAGLRRAEGLRPQTRRPRRRRC
jgi:IclR family transcriptional regulator, acetate operon repressor